MSYANSISIIQSSSSILDQGYMNSCVENAIVSDIDILMRQAGQPVAPLSRLQNYADTRDAQNSFAWDSGSYPEKALDAGMTKGIANESSFAYDPANLYVHPSQAVYDEAAQHKITSWSAIKTYDGESYQDVRDSIKAVLVQGKPIILSFAPQQYFFKEHGPLYGQKVLGFDGNILGHAVLIIGADDTLNGGSYIVKNSWGTSWGDNGYGAISYQQFSKEYLPAISDPFGLDVVNGFNGIDFTYTPERHVVEQDYIAVFNRPADIKGMDFWTTEFDKGISKVDIVNDFIRSSEGKLLYSHTSNSQFVTEVFNNILGRNADATGLFYYTHGLDTGTSRGQIVVDILNDVDKVDSVDILAHDYLINKTNLSEYISIALQYNGSNNSQMSLDLGMITDANSVEVIKVGIPHQLGYV